MNKAVIIALDFKNFDEVIGYFEYISPVPGGVGPMTIAMLMKNVLRAYEKGLAHD